MSTPETYQVVASTGAVVDDCGSSIHYPAGSVFQGNPGNSSIRALVAARTIVSSPAALAGLPATIEGIEGPRGPRGLPGGPAGSLYSVKIRTVPLTTPLLLEGSIVRTLAWPLDTEVLYDEKDMFVRSSDPEKIYIKPGGSGRYHAEAEVRFVTNHVGDRYAAITQYDQFGTFKDSAEKSVGAVAGLPTILSLSGDFDCVETDYFTLSYQQTSPSRLSGGASLSLMLMGSGGTGERGPIGSQGLKGDKGDVGETGAPGVNWRGAWNSTTSYAPGDGVSHSGSSFVAINASLNDPPLSANWLIIAAQGATGETGAPGSDGFDGVGGVEGLTNKWLAVKARLDALPPVPEEGPDFYAVVRARLISETQAAFDEVIDAGGPG